MFRTALKIYEMDINSYPSSSQGLEALLEMPSGLKNESRYRGPYLEDIKVLPLDPWDNPYKYESDGTQYTISSAGADGVVGNDDDISSE
jgi:general secretion pathway protein G